MRIFHHWISIHMKKTYPCNFFSEIPMSLLNITEAKCIFLILPFIVPSCLTTNGMPPAEDKAPQCELHDK